MDWKPLLSVEVEMSAAAAEKLIKKVDDSELGWKPSTGENWMTMAHLLEHLSRACGKEMKGFVTGDWGMPEGMDMENMKPEDMLPPADKLPKVDSVEQAVRQLHEDKQLALDMISQCSEDDLDNRKMTAPWGGPEQCLGHHLLNMADHLKQHKGQLFYYLKLQNKPVNTWHLYGMG